MNEKYLLKLREDLQLKNFPPVRLDFSVNIPCLF